MRGHKCIVLIVLAWLLLALVVPAQLASAAIGWRPDAESAAEGSRAAPSRPAEVEDAEDAREQRPWSAYDRLKVVNVESANVGKALYDVLRHE
jgi:hypothetical protein